MMVDPLFTSYKSFEEALAAQNRFERRFPYYMVAVLLLLIVFVGSCTDVRAEGVSNDEREYCLQQSYDMQQIATNKFNGVTQDQLGSYIMNLPDDAVPEGYKESVLVGIMWVYSHELETVEEYQQVSLIECLKWHEENSQQPQPYKEYTF